MKFPAKSTITLAIFFTGVALSLRVHAAGTSVPQVYVLDGTLLAEGRALAQQTGSDAHAALQQLVDAADAALKKPAGSVMDKQAVPSSGDKHDYMSRGPYWWPDPKKQDGLPYIRRDGEVNPEAKDNTSDVSRSKLMSTSAHTLALAFYFSGDERYARHASLLLRTWFLDPATRMNPNLNFGQAIPGRTEGRGIGIIETLVYLNVIDTAALLVDSESWTAADHRQLQAWFRDYLEWLRTSPHGKAEAVHPNNHSTWYDAQVAGFALFVDDEHTARSVLHAAGDKILKAQITTDGKQPHELRRTRSFTYSCMNLRGMMTLARLGEYVDVDLWNYPPNQPSLIRSALDFLAPYADPANAWPYKQITNNDPGTLLPLLRAASRAYGGVAYSQAEAMIPEATRRSHLVHLVSPDTSDK